MASLISLKKLLQHAAYALTISNTVVPSDAALTFLLGAKKANSTEATVAKCSTYALFLYKNAFFPKKICVCAFFVVPLQPISELTRSDGPDGGIGRRAGLKHQWSNPCRFDPGSGYSRPLNHKLSGLFKKRIIINP